MPYVKKRHVRQSKLASFDVMYKICVILGIFVRLVLMVMLGGEHLVVLSCIWHIWGIHGVSIAFRMYVVLPKNSGNLNRAPEPVVVCPSAARCG